MLALEDRTFRAFAALMHEITGVHLGPAKKALVANRLAARVQRLGLAGYEDYLALVRGAQGGGELQMTIDLLTTNETYFFREEPHFRVMERELRAVQQRPVTVWSAASSYGDEAYSAAMVLADMELAGRTAPHWSVLGTDISDRVLRAAQEAVYPELRLREVTPARRKRYCLRGTGESEGLAMVRPELAAHVSFGRLNLSQPIDVPGPFDVIFLRNVLIYFDAATKRAVVDRVLEQLRPGGLFFVGMAEGRPDTATPLRVVSPGAYVKTGN